MILLDTALGPSQTARIPAPASSARIPSVRTLTRFLREAQTVAQLRGQVTVLLTTDRRIRTLNRDFRGKDKATDVLSFPAEPGPENLAGDLAISVPTARKQAAANGHALSVEIKILILHGLLHLAGYDHETDSGQMARRERALRSQLGLPLGLIERAEKSTTASSARSLRPPVPDGNLGDKRRRKKRSAKSSARRSAR